MPDADVLKVSFTVASGAPSVHVAFVAPAPQRTAVHVGIPVSQRTAVHVRVRKPVSQFSADNVRIPVSQFSSDNVRIPAPHVRVFQRDRDRDRDPITESTSNPIELSNPNAFCGGKEC